MAAKRKKAVDPVASARARAAHEERRARLEQDAEDARKYREMMASQEAITVPVSAAGTATNVARADNVHVPTEQPLGGEAAEAVAEAQEGAGALPIVEVPLGTPLVRTPSTKSEEVKAAEHQAALAQAAAATQEARDPFPTVPQDDPATADIVIHFIEDGFSALGKVFYRGETLTIKRGSEAFQATAGKDGKSWLDDDADEQMRRRHKVYYLPGVFPKTADGMPTDEEEAAALLSNDPDDLLRIKKRKARAATARSSLLTR